MSESIDQPRPPRPVWPLDGTDLADGAVLDGGALLELLEAAPDGTVLVDAGGLIAFVNRRLEALTGYRRSDLLGQPVEVLVPETARAAHGALGQGYRAAPRARLMGGGAPLEIRLADGSSLAVEISLAPVQIGAHRLTAASVRDVDTQRADDRARRRLLRLLDLGPDMVFVLNAETLRIEYANVGAERLLGYRRDELQDMTLSELSPYLTEPMRTGYGTEWSGGAETRPPAAPVVRRSRDGADIPCDEHGQLVVDPVDGTVRLIIVDRDARDRLAAETIRTSHAELAALAARVTMLVLSDAAPDDVSREIVEGAAALVQAQQADLVLWNDVSGRFELVGASGAPGRSGLGAGVDVDGPVMASWAGAGRTFVLSELPAATGAPAVPIGPAVIAPLRGPGPARGALACFRPVGGPPFTPDEVDLLADLARQVATVLGLGHARASHQQLALLEDRERIARDLHDTVIQDLIGVGMQLDGGLRTTADPARRARDNLLIDELDESIRRLRTIVFDSRRPPSSRTVTDTLRATVAEASRSLGHQPALLFAGPVDALPAAVVDHLIPALREALSNVARHAHASTTTVSVSADGGGVTLMVDDDGGGPGPPDAAGTGTANLSRRATILGGTSRLSARVSGGSRLRWTAAAGPPAFP